MVSRKQKERMMDKAIHRAGALGYEIAYPGSVTKWADAFAVYPPIGKVALYYNHKGFADMSTHTIIEELE